MTKDRIVWKSLHRDTGEGVVAVSPGEIAGLKAGQFAPFRFGLDLVPGKAHPMLCKGFPLKQGRVRRKSLQNPDQKQGA